jgi:hypothetical protein
MRCLIAFQRVSMAFGRRARMPADFLLFTFRPCFHASSTDDFAINEFGAGGIIY